MPSLRYKLIKQLDGRPTLYEYVEYVVTNRSESELPVVFFGLSVGDSCRLESLTSPRDWSHSDYKPKDAWIPWETKTNAIKPGGQARFTFTTTCKMTEQSFSVMGPDPTGSYVRDDSEFIILTKVIFILEKNAYASPSKVTPKKIGDQ